MKVERSKTAGAQFGAIHEVVMACWAMSDRAGGGPGRPG